MTNPTDRTGRGDVITMLDRVITEAEGVRGDVAAANRIRRRDNRVTHAAAVVIVLLLVAAIVLTAQNQRLARQNTDLGRQNQRISELIADCTTEGGTCYEEGRRRTGDAISEVVRANIAVQQCAERVSPDLLESCVSDALDGRPPR